MCCAAQRLGDNIGRDADQRACDDICGVVCPPRDLGEAHRCSGCIEPPPMLRERMSRSPRHCDTPGSMSGRERLPRSSARPTGPHLVAPFIEQDVRPRSRDEPLDECLSGRREQKGTKHPSGGPCRPGSARNDAISQDDAADRE